MVVGGVLVLPEALPNLLEGMRRQPFAPLIAAGFWAAATAASITGKRLIAAGHLGWTGTTTAHITGTVANRLIPAGVGAAGAFVAALRRAGASNTMAAGAVAMWSAGGCVAYAGGLLLSLAWLWGGGSLLVVAIAMVVLMIVTGPNLARRAGSAIRGLPVWARASRGAGSQPRTGMGRVLRDRMYRVACAAREIASSVRARPKVAVGVVVTQILAMLSMAAGFAMVTASFGLPVTIAVGMAAYVAGTALAATTPTPAGIGSAEATLVGALVVVGVAASDALPAVLLFRAVVLLAPVVIAVILATVWPAAHKIAHGRRPA
nr:lysylphosphatidylglycerol synthase domain-containing protein [Phytoactinopolyspora mesophila]